MLKLQNAVQPLKDGFKAQHQYLYVICPIQDQALLFQIMLAGLLEPTEGTVLLDGTDLYAMDDRERARLRNASIGVIP